MQACKGDGINKIEMHFLSDVYVTCEDVPREEIQSRDIGSAL